MKKQYRYFRDMISDVKYMNPYDTLKIINPNEVMVAPQGHSLLSNDVIVCACDDPGQTG